MNGVVRGSFFVLLFIFSLSSFAAESKTDQKEWLATTLNLLEEKFTLSTFSRQEVNDHALIDREVDGLVTLALETYPNDLAIQIPCVHLLYVQGNHYLYKDRPVLAQKKLLLAKKLCEQGIEAFEIKSAEEMCQSLGDIDRRLPSFYAQILHLLGKAYIYPPDAQNRLQWREGEDFLIKAVEVQEYIEMHPELFDDEIDKPAVKKSLTFKRLIGVLHFDKGLLDQSGQLFLELKQEPDELNQLICLKHLIQICQKMGETAQTIPLRESFFQTATDYSYQVLKLLDSFPDLNRISIYFSIIGNLYQDPVNPFRDVDLALSFFEKAKSSNRSDLKSMQVLVHQGLTKIYAELSLSENKKAKSTQWDYAEVSSSDFLKEINDRLERKVVSYEEMGDIYHEKGEWILAIALYSNAFSLLKNEHNPQAALLRERLLRKMEQTERAFYPPLKGSKNSYPDLLNGYRQKLAKIRQETALKLDNSAVEEIYGLITGAYKELLGEILNDAMSQFGKPSTNFSLIAGGSIARGMATPYSDVELAFLISEEADEIQRQQIKELALLFTLRLIAVGETPISYLKMPVLEWLSYNNCPSANGFMLDPGQISPFEFYLETPKELAQKLHHGELSKNLPRMCLRSSFLNFDLVSGSSSLALDCKKELDRLFSEQERNADSRDLLWIDLTRYEIKKQFYEKTQGYSIKHDFYRPLSMILNYLTFKFGKFETQTSWSLIRNLQENGLIDPFLAEIFFDLLDNIGRLRLEIYLKANQQQESLTTSQMNPLDKRKTFSYWMEESFLTKINQKLAALQGHVKSFELNCHSLITGLAIDQQVAFALLEFEHLQHYFEKEISVSFFDRKLGQNLNGKLLKSYGLFLMNLGENEKAQEIFKKYLLQARSELERADALHHTGLSYFSPHQSKTAHAFLKDSLEIYQNILNSDNPLIIDVTIDFGRSLLEQGDEKGLKLIFECIEKDLEFYGKGHPFISYDYYRLGLALQKKQHHHEAKSYFEKALKIDRIYYGDRHWRVANYYRELGICCMHLCDPMKAIEYFRIVLEIDHYFVGDHHALSAKDGQLLRDAVAVSDENRLPLEKTIVPGVDSKCNENKLAESYQNQHPLFKAKKLNSLALEALQQGDIIKSEDYFKRAKIILSSYYKRAVL